MLKSARAPRSPWWLALFPSLCITSPLRRDRYGFSRVTLPHNGGWITVPAHRVAYSLYIEQARPGVSVRHTCGNPACINPRHLVSSDVNQGVCHG